MKQIILALFSVLLYLTSFAQNDVTKFLGFPIDGSEHEMIQNLKSKGFKPSSYEQKKYLTGRFNGVDVNVYISTENGKVARIMVCDENTRNETDIRIRFNKLCEQFNNNGKYVSFNDFKIPEDEDIGYEILVHNKRYEAEFFQLPEKSVLENFQQSYMNSILETYILEDLKDDEKEKLKEHFISEMREALYELVKNKPVWFMISEFRGEYYISMYYDNEYNHAHGEDL